jgi:hypothetical protein
LILKRKQKITKLNKEKNQCIRKKTGAQNIVMGIKQCQKIGYNMYRGWKEIECTEGGQK